MIGDKKVLCIIPARRKSKGLPGKNIRSLGGKPLVGWPIHTAKNSKYVDSVVVSTEDQGIAEIARKEGAEVPFLRPEELSTDSASTISVLKHAIHSLRAAHPCDYVLLLEPTSPLTESSDVDLALETLDTKRLVADSIVAVSEVVSAHPCFDVLIDEQGLIRPFMGSGFQSPSRRQDISKLYFLEGSLYVSDVDVLLEHESFCHDRTLSYVVPKWKSFEIDDIVDFYCVEAIMKRKQEIMSKHGTEPTEEHGISKE
ncbi:cytidylyltransferase domain-containing protein [Planctomycetota bacterium]